MNVLDQKKEMCLSFDTPPSVYRYKRINYRLEFIVYPKTEHFIGTTIDRISS